MNRTERKTQSLTAKADLKQSRNLKPKAGKKLKRWKKALAAAAQTPAASE